MGVLLTKDVVEEWPYTDDLGWFVRHGLTEEERRAYTHRVDTELRVLSDRMRAELQALYADEDRCVARRRGRHGWRVRVETMRAEERARRAKQYDAVVARYNTGRCRVETEAFVAALSVQHAFGTGLFAPYDRYRWHLRMRFDPRNTVFKRLYHRFYMWYLRYNYSELEQWW